MTDEEKLLIAITLLNMGHKDIRFLESGPQLWGSLPNNEIKEENIPEYLTACMMNNNASAATLISTKRNVLHKYVDALADAFEEWAKDAGRTDLLLTVGERLEQAVKS